ncbi:MAG: ribonuclease P protein component [Alphaproteobacteria bacterium]|nr:ribonuclease P protein component [Alphaproteobacteria bacterium]
MRSGHTPDGTRPTFPREVRLRRSVDFRRVQSRGRRARTRHLLVLYTRGRGDRTRFGLVVSRKVGNAVTRNRVKRWLREAIRRNRWRVSGCWDLAIIASPRAATAGLAAITDELITVFERLGAR